MACICIVICCSKFDRIAQRRAILFYSYIKRAIFKVIHLEQFGCIKSVPLTLIVLLLALSFSDCACAVFGIPNKLKAKTNASNAVASAFDLRLIIFPMISPFKGQAQHVYFGLHSRLIFILLNHSSTQSN